jgi:adenylate kinase
VPRARGHDAWAAQLPMRSVARPIVLLGPPGAGKGTQATRLTRRWRVPHISTGAMLREAVRAGSDLGRRVQAVMETGALVDDALMTEVVDARLARADAAAGFLLDGYPRTVPQAETLDGLLGARGPLVVIEIAVAEAEVLRRLAARMVCAECGANAQDDREFATCHDCGGALVPRADDAEDVVRARMEVYRCQTAPLIAYYEARPWHVRVDGARLVDDVTDEIMRRVAALPAS